ncbi:hypothetical protein [Rothia dentocariosa]|uniref:hypothetical protein n=1 Tax=Rothia dentocariosa TaxID=2047 RepID=UPI000A5A9A94|nr:hypothetical protein [Rothia dentocariosa]
MKDFSYNGSAEQFTEVIDYVEAHREEAMITVLGMSSLWFHLFLNTNHSEKICT